MLKDLKFVMGAVAKKDLLPAMTHFRIEKGHVRSFNGQMAISSPIAFDIDCNPKADQLIKAITQCDEEIVLSMTAGGRLRVQSGRFRAFVETVEGETVHPMPEGEELAINGDELLAACKVLQPFIGNDASRPWANGMLFQGHSAFATNNASLVEYWLGTPVPFQINLSRSCVAELLRVDEAPTYAQLHERSITFHYTDGRWIRSQLIDGEWPFEKMTAILNAQCKPKHIPPELFTGIETLKKMADGSSRIYIKDGMLKTHLEEFTGGVYELDGIEFEGCYNLSIFNLLNGVAMTADFTLYPSPALFFGERVRGAIIGMRM
jgi:hypothetical protein